MFEELKAHFTNYKYKKQKYATDFKLRLMETTPDLPTPLKSVNKKNLSQR